MLRRLSKLIVLASLLLFAIGLRPLEAATYYIGSGAPAGANSYANLQTLYAAHPTLNNDTLIFYDAIDASWTNRSPFTVTGTLNLRSNVTGEERIISGNDVGGRIFEYNGATVTIGSEFVFEHVDSSASGTMSLHGSTVLTTDGVTYRHNSSSSFGGAIDTHGGSTQWINARGANFHDNTGERGGGVELYRMRGGDFTNANFIDNTATSRPGGAIIVLLFPSIPAEVILGATDGQTSTFSGNAYTGGGSVLANSLYITDSGTVNVNIVTEGSGVLDLIDPIYLTPGSNYTANFTKMGTGTWKVDGNTQINTGSGRSTISIREGVFFMYSGAQINMTGDNDSFTVARDAQVLLMGNNTITGTSVRFDPGSNLVFDFDYFFGGGGPIPTTPMLNLSGTTGNLAVQGTRIDIANVPFGNVPIGRYALIDGGETPLTVGDFELWIGNVLVDDFSRRFGYGLSYDIPEQLALLVTETQNRVLTWQNHERTGQWNFLDKNWDLPNYTEPTDSFILGDAVVFNLTGDHTVALGTSMPFSSIDNEPGMRVSGSGNWTFRGGSFGDLHNPGVVEDKGQFVFDGTGTVTLSNDLPNTHHGGTIISGGGLLTASRGDQLGNGDIRFRSNVDNRLVFNVQPELQRTRTTTLEQQLFVEAGSQGTLTAAPRTTLIVTQADGNLATQVATGGRLTLGGDIRFAENTTALRINGGTVVADGTQFLGNDVAVHVGTQGTFEGSGLRFSGNEGSAVYQPGSGTTTIRDSQFTVNNAEFGGAVMMSGGTVHLWDSEFRNNTASEYGGAVHYQAATNSRLTLGASDGKASLFSGNTDSTGANSVSVSGSSGVVARIDITTEGTGVLDMRDPMSGQTGSYRADITKLGDGTWRLDGDSTFAGNNTQFTITEGKLELYEDATIGIINGTFAIEATGALVAQGGNDVTSQSISLARGATIGFNLAGYDPGNDPLLDLTATSWTVNGWSQNIDLVSLGTGGDGVYNLMTATGTTFDVTNMVLMYRGEAMASLRERLGRLEVSGATLQFVADVATTNNGTVRWTNESADGRWNTSSFNWEGQEPHLTGVKQFLPHDAVLFGDTGAGTVTVNAGGVDIGPQDGHPGMTVDNSADKDYVFVGGSIDGSGGLLKLGAGTVTFHQKNNTFSDGTEIRGGTVVAMSVGSLGIDGINTGDAAGKGTLVFDLDTSSSGVFAQKIDGTGDLVKWGDGDLTLTNTSNDYDGTTTIRGGKLIVNNDGAIGKGRIDTGLGDEKGSLVFDLLDDGEVHQMIRGTGNIVMTGSIVKINEDDDADSIPARSAATTLTLYGDNDNYSGVTIIEDGRLVRQYVLKDEDGEVVKGKDGPVIIAEEELKRNRLIAGHVNALGTGDVVNDGILELDFGDGTSKDFNQWISGTGDLIKTGNNTLRLMAANTHGGTTTFDAGKLSIADKLALQNSTLNILGGTFGFETLTEATLGGLSGSAPINLANDAGFAIALTLGNNGENAAYSGNLGGKGSLTKIGLGTQTLSGTNTYVGGTLIEEGRLVAIGLDALGTGTVQTNAELDLRIDGHETLDYAISGTGSVIKSGDGLLEYAVGQTYSGATIVSEGTLKVGSFAEMGIGSVNVHSKGILIVGVDKNMELAKDVSVVGRLVKTGGGILTINDDTALAGRLDIEGGGLFVNETIKSLTTMGEGTMLGGNGWIDNTVIFRSGAAHVVGPQGTTNQHTFSARNFEYDGGSTVYVKVGKYGSDRIIAEDGFHFAKNGGTVNVIFLSLDDFGNEEITASYEVFTASGGTLLLDGKLIDNYSSTSSTLQINGVKGKVQFLSGDGELDVAGHSVYAEEGQRSISVDLLVTSGNAYSYLNDNQRQTLLGVGSAEVFDRFFKTMKEYRGDLLNELMPNLQTAMPYISQRAVTQYTLATFERLRFLREPLGLDGNPGYRGSSHRLMQQHGKNNYIWFQNFGSFLRTEADSYCPGLHADGYGFSIGVDRKIDACSVAGAGLGGYFAKARTTDSLQDGKANSFLLSAYGLRTLQDDWTLAGSSGFSFNRYSIDRNAPSFGTTLSSGHNGTAVYAAAELARKFLFNKLELSPFLNVNWIWLWEAGATERANGNPDLALRIDGQDTSSFLTTIGMRVGRSFRMLEKNIINPSFYFGWTQDWGRGRVRTSAAFPNEPVFTIRGASMRNNRAIVGLNLNMTLSDRTDLFARFNSELAERYSDLSMHWGIRLGF